MEIDAKEYHDFLTNLLKLFKQLETSLTAYRAFADEVTQAFPKLAPVLLASFHGAQAEMDAKYDPMLQNTSAEPSQESVDRALKQLLAQWKPKGPAN